MCHKQVCLPFDISSDVFLVINDCTETFNGDTIIIPDHGPILKGVY